MDRFIVSARKYRPQLFDAVVGQSHITTTLKNAIRHNQLAHAFLFCGPRGVGKTTCARILAKTINCEKITKEGEACNKCKSCVSFNEGTSLNIHELDAASNNSVDDIRTLVDQVRFAPQAGKYKVYIIDEVHMAQIHALLLVSADPLTQDDIMEELNISRGNVNMNIRELISWGLVERVILTGERKEFFTAEKDIWKVVKMIVKERKKRELEPMLQLLDRLEEVEGDKRDKSIKSFVDTVSSIKKLGRQADKTLDTMIHADENWFVGGLMKIFK